MLPLSLYVHIPWCIRKCPYCDFNSHKSPDTLPELSYVQALLDDLTRDVSHYLKRPLTSIFIGGGTPSLFSAEAYEALFTGIKPLLPFADDIEITLEANPGTVEQHRFNDYRALGINRLSLGIQSFNASHLKALGRIHDDTQAHRAIEAARGAGFNNINLDIMHGLPNQTPEQGLSDLRAALNHQPEHISWYQLTLEPNTVFYKTRPPLPSEEDLYRLEQRGLALLQQTGYHRYELSAFARDEKLARHNLNYWLFGDYYGIGAGAHGKLTSPDWHVHRTRKHRMPQEYLTPEKAFLAETTLLTTDDLIFEFMLNTTRLEQPIELKHFTERTGLPFDALKPQLLEAQNKGLVTLTTTHWQITPFGRRYTNDLQALFLHI